MWSWFKGYLSSRSQCVSVRGQRSDFLPVLSGVPQGSILGPLLFLIYINDLPTFTSFSFPLLFADDTKCLKQITNISDCHLLQEDILSLSYWSSTTRLSFNSAKCTLLRFCTRSPQFDFTYSINNNAIMVKNCHRDLGVLMSNTLNWSAHYDAVSSRAYKILGLLRRSFSGSCSIRAKKLLYMTLVRSQLSFCSSVWRPHLIKDIKSLERIQRRATKFIINGSSINYRTRLQTLELFPLMYYLEMNDMLFFLKCLKDPPDNFNILDFVSFSTNATRSGSTHKLNHTCSSSNTTRFFYFNRLPLLWNSLPPLDLDLSYSSLKSKIRKHLWNHFLTHFDDQNPCSFHSVCPCSKCYTVRRPILLT